MEEYFQIFNYKLQRKFLVIFILCIVGLFFFRWDFSYNLKDYRVKPGDTLWGILNSVYDHPNITQASLKYIKFNFFPIFDTNVILANQDNQGGDVVRIKNNIMTIYGPNEAVVLQTQILPDVALLNHFLQVISYDIILICSLIIVYQLLKIYNFKYFKDFRNDVIKLVLHPFVLLILIIILILSFVFWLPLFSILF